MGYLREKRVDPGRLLTAGICGRDSLGHYRVKLSHCGMTVVREGAGGGFGDLFVWPEAVCQRYADRM